MMCERCNENEANVRFVQTINGKTTKLNLCEKCAQELNIGANFSFSNMFSGMFDNFSPIGDMLNMFEVPSYPKTNILRIGIPNYKIFDDDGTTNIDEILGTKREDKTKKEVNQCTPELKELKVKLDECIRKEEYEEAAKLRDKIKDIEKKSNE